MRKPTTFELIRSFDPVLRRHVSSKDAGEWAIKRDGVTDRARLEQVGLPPDARPTVFVCSALKRSERDRLDMYGSVETRWRMAFRIALVEVRDIDDDGKLRSWTPTRVDGELDDAALDQLEEFEFGADDELDIGMAVYILSSLGKGVPPSLPLLGSSQRSWGALSMSRPAAPNEGESTGD